MEFLKPDNWIYKKKKFLFLADCKEASWITYQQLEKIGAKRVRGMRGSVGTHHYWVEAKGYVYDSANMVLLIAPIQEFYDKLEIRDVEYADEGIFYKNNHTLKLGRDDMDFIESKIIKGRKVLSYSITNKTEPKIITGKNTAFETKMEYAFEILNDNKRVAFIKKHINEITEPN